jgi:hypothetical protein
MRSAATPSACSCSLARWRRAPISRSAGRATRRWRQPSLAVTARDPACGGQVVDEARMAMEADAIAFGMAVLALGAVAAPGGVVGPPPPSPQFTRGLGGSAAPPPASAGAAESAADPTRSWRPARVRPFPGPVLGEVQPPSCRLRGHSLAPRRCPANCSPPPRARFHHDRCRPSCRRAGSSWGRRSPRPISQEAYRGAPPRLRPHPPAGQRDAGRARSACPARACRAGGETARRRWWRGPAAIRAGRGGKGQ